MYILIAENRENVRSAIRLLLEQQTESNLIEEVGTGSELVEYVICRCPDLIILDWSLPEMTSGLISKIRNSRSNLILIVIDSNPLIKNQALLAGADFFISKNDPPEKLITAIHQSAEKILARTILED